MDNFENKSKELHEKNEKLKEKRLRAITTARGKTFNLGHGYH